MPNLVTLGKISRPHGYRGEFVAVGDAGPESALAYIKTLFIGKDASNIRSFQVVETAWMPRGWKIKVEGITSEVEVKALQGALLFAERDQLSALSDNEYYLGDLENATVIDHASGKVIGRFRGAESMKKSQGPDRWWIDTDAEQLVIPATSHYVDHIDVAQKTIYVKNLPELK
jgi:16S rRNA processing protein RimM